MRTFTAEQARLAVELEQMCTDYWREVDFNGGANAVVFFTEDVVADFGAIKFTGHAGVRAYYADRSAKISAMQLGGVRTTRHVFHNFHITFDTEDRATMRFVIATYAGSGPPPVFGAMSPVSISDTTFECRCEADGQWRIFGFAGAPIFISDEPFARKALTGT